MSTISVQMYHLELFVLPSKTKKTDISSNRSKGSTLYVKSSEGWLQVSVSPLRLWRIAIDSSTNPKYELTGCRNIFQKPKKGGGGSMSQYFPLSAITDGSTSLCMQLGEHWIVPRCRLLANTRVKVCHRIFHFSSCSRTVVLRLFDVTSIESLIFVYARVIAWSPVQSVGKDAILTSLQAEKIDL